jgi:hypothetical protein
MFQQFENQQKETMEATLKSFSAVSKGAQAVLAELANFAKQSSEQNTALVQKLLSVKSPEKVAELYSDSLKSNYEGVVALSTRLGDLYSNIAKEAAKPIEGAVAKASNSSVKAAA